MTSASNAPSLADLPARDVLTVDGVGSPETPAFGAAIRALVLVRAALGGRDDLPIEGSYAQDGDPLRFDLDKPDGWHWQLLAPAPPDASAAAVAEAAEGSDAPVQLRRAPARRVAQVLHLGPYEDEAPSLAALYAFIAEQGLEPAEAHTEVYLNDPSTTAPADLRTILRVPVTTKD
jgi:hypothetical protein